MLYDVVSLLTALLELHWFINAVFSGSCIQCNLHIPARREFPVPSLEMIFERTAVWTVSLGKNLDTVLTFIRWSLSDWHIHWHVWDIGLFIDISDSKMIQNPSFSDLHWVGCSKVLFYHVLFWLVAVLYQTQLFIFYLYCFWTSSQSPKQESLALCWAMFHLENTQINLIYRYKI